MEGGHFALKGRSNKFIDVLSREEFRSELNKFKCHTIY